MKCKAVLPCEKIIVDKMGAHSIINVMLRAEVQIKSVDPNRQVDEVPPNAVAPSQWWIYTLWEPTPADLNKQFEQVYQVYWPNGGDKVIEGRLQFQLKELTFQQTTYTIMGLPVGKVGDLAIKTWLDSAGQRVTDIIETHLEIKHGVSEATLSAGSAGNLALI